MTVRKSNGKTFDSNLLLKIFEYVRPYSNTFFWSIVFTITIAIVAPIRPWLIQYTVDNYIIKFDAEGLLWMTVLTVVLVILQSILQYFYTFSTNRLGQSVIQDLRRDVFQRLINFRLKFFDKTPIGQLVTRTVSDMETIADIFSEGVIVILGDILQLVTIVGVMLYTDWKLTFIVLIPMPLLVLSTYIFKEAIKSAFQSVRTQVGLLNTFLQEHITGISIIQYFAREEQEFEKFKFINAEHRDAHVRSNWYYSIFFPVVEIISALSIGLLVWYGSKQILAHQISAGVVVSFIMYINLLFRPIRELADKFNTLQMGMVGADRVIQLLESKEETPDFGSIQPKGKLAGTIAFKDVYFSYNEGNPILKNVSFQINAGETLAIVGATGAGKSSIINIINRFYEYDKGLVSIDGIDIREYDLNYLRSQIAVVLQDVFLFSGSIADNIRLQDNRITLEQVVAATQEIGAHEFIKKLPKGYDYQVMERGATLSAGQAQLISFARALVHHPSILILDEATASVDTETEQLIQQGIEKLMQNRTCIVIAHRLSTIQKAKQIIVLDQGEIKEIGNHQELLQKQGYYKRLYDLQFSSSGIVLNEQGI